MKNTLFLLILFQNTIAFCQSNNQIEIKKIGHYEFSDHVFDDLSAFESRFYELDDGQLIDLYLEQVTLENKSNILAFLGGTLLGFGGTLLVSNKDFANKEVLGYPTLIGGIALSTLSLHWGRKSKRLIFKTIQRYNELIENQ